MSGVKLANGVSEQPGTIKLVWLVRSTVVFVDADVDTATVEELSASNDFFVSTRTCFELNQVLEVLGSLLSVGLGRNLRASVVVRVEGLVDGPEGVVVVLNILEGGNSSIVDKDSLSPGITDHVALHVRSAGSPLGALENLDDWNLSKIGGNNVRQQYPRGVSRINWVDILASDGLVHAHEHVAVIGGGSVVEFELEILVLGVLVSSILLEADLREGPHLLSESSWCSDESVVDPSGSCFSISSVFLLDQNLASGVNLLPVGFGSVSRWISSQTFVGLELVGNAFPGIVSSSTASLGLEVGIKLRDGGLIELAVEFADDDSVDVWLGTLGWGLEGLVFPEEIINVGSIVLAQSLISSALEDSVGVADVVVRIQLVVSVGENFEFA